MSLNGLDGAAVAEAHQAALAEAGGWYVSRGAACWGEVMLTRLTQVSARVCQSRHGGVVEEGKGRSAGSEERRGKV
jgi:hypothetical protein